MVLEISNCENCYKLSGNLTRHNLHIFFNAFQNIFEETDDLTISIEGVMSIDRYGVNAIAKLHNESLNKQKKFSLIGLGNRELIQEFKSNDAA